ncbi:hypothetical protein K4K54_004528 [Colletotrichum sp. SAR 10_86]|nr:hypothetical protein K4K52_009511 [Colletotrichum sp. SAR 10_76]KAI8236092.1 hypothetical protein K4K54_004528 [Colletotrichum sp. SAR 10_86]
MKLPWGGDTSYALESFGTFAERWEEICYDLRTNKLIIHSALRPDNIARLTAAPRAERKTDNCRLNAKRDEESRLGRERQNITKKKAAALDVGDEHMED